MEISIGEILMKNTELKKIFMVIAKEDGFYSAYGGWFKEFEELTQVIELQKSNYANYYYLNFKIFIQGIFGNVYVKNKRMVQPEMGNIFLRHPDNYSHLLDMRTPLSDSEREAGLRELFANFIMPLSNNTTSKEAIKALHAKGKLFVLGAVQEELGIHYEEKQK